MSASSADKPRGEAAKQLRAARAVAKLTEKLRQRSIADTFRAWLLVGVVLAFAVTVILSWILIGSVFSRTVENLLDAAVEDVYDDIADESDEKILGLAYEVAAELETYEKIDNYDLKDLCFRFDISEINIINEEGIIVASNYPGFCGYDMASGEQSAEFLVLLEGESEFVQGFRAMSFDDLSKRKYAGIAREEGGFVQIGYDEARFQEDIGEQINVITSNRHVGERGYLIVSDQRGHIVSCSNGAIEGGSLASIGLWIDGTIPQKEVFKRTVLDEPSFCLYAETEGYCVIGVLPQDMMGMLRHVVMALMTFSQAIVFAVLFYLVNRAVRDLVAHSVHKINASLSRVTAGDLDEVVDVRVAKEFDELSDGINYTVGSLKNLIAEAEARFDRELEYARQIQFAALPKVFPPIPERVDQFDVFASTTPAREVGGDFYDVFALEDGRLVFLVADVSDKGIPAALFMMRTKELIKSHVLSGLALNEALSMANDELACDNETDMFVTVWAGVFDPTTGKVEYSNAGHEAPLVRRESGTFEFLTGRSGFVLAGMEGMKYRLSEMELRPGDEVFLYTDGVTDAQNAAADFFGAERLREELNKQGDLTARQRCERMSETIASFVGEAAQFDDVTMLSFIYKQPPRKEGWRRKIVKELTIEATIENIGVVTDFVDEQLEIIGCPMKIQMQIDIAIDELLSNIAQYAYDPETGPATVRVEVTRDPLEVIVTFIDHGKPYDPLARKDPDTEASAEDREIGGLGIYLVKQTMDDVAYEYKEGRNILRITKRLY